MQEFFDTSVLVAAFWAGHPNHHPSIKLLSAATRKRSACSLHTIAELYAVMTALPVRPPIPPDQVMLFIKEIRDRLSIIPLTETEYLETLQTASEAAITGGRLYDALLLRCAEKSKAT